MATAPAEPTPILSVRGTIAALRIPTSHQLLFSVKAAIAVVLSLLIGFSQDLENPYWSALTVYVLLQPAAGAFRAKAIFRFVGTLLGGVVSILLASVFASHLGVLLISSIVAILIAYYGKTLDRTPTTYTWFATALTIAVVAIAQIQAPATIFMYANTRMAEICLAILLTGLVDSVILPQAATPAFVKAMTDWHQKASDWAAAALAPDASQEPGERKKRRLGLHHLAALLGPLDAFSVQLPYDIVPMPPRRRDLRFLRLTIARLIAHLASANIWIETAQRSLGSAPEVAAMPGTVRAWLLDRPATTDGAILDHALRGEDLRDRLLATEVHEAGTGDRDALLRATTMLRLAELVDHWAKFERALYATATGTRLPVELRREARHARPVRSIDYLLGLLDTFPMGLALGFTALLWYITTWNGSIPAMLFIFISLGFILGTPGALRAAKGITVWISITALLTLIYQFAVLPRVTAFPVLIAVLLVGILPLGVLMTMSPAFLLILANGFAFLALQNAYGADFGATLENLLGSMAGCMIAVIALHLCRFDRSRFRARRLASAVRRDLVDVAQGRHAPSRDRLLSLSVDRLALFFGIADGLPEGDPLHHNDLVDTFRMTANLARLRDLEAALPLAALGPLQSLRFEIAAGYAPDSKPNRTLLQTRTESVYDAALAMPAGPPRTQALAALTGLRVSLSLSPVFAVRPGEGQA